MKKKCEKCGNDFEALQPYHRICPNCHKNPKQANELPSDLLLSSYYDGDGQPLKDIFIGSPQKLAHFFANDKPPLAIKQLRNFHKIISKARKKAMLHGISSVRHILYKCSADIEYQHTRKVIPQSFYRFMKHHIEIAAQEQNMLEGFYQHLDCIVCYYPKQKGGIVQ